MIEAGLPSAHTRLVRNTALSLVAIGLLGAGRLVYNVVAGRRFGAAALGEVTLAINAAMFASLLVSGGWQATTARYVAQALGRGDAGEAASIFRRTLAHNTAGGIVLAVVVAAGLDRLPGVDLSRRDAILAGATVLAYNAYQHLKAASYGFGRVGEYLANEVVSSGVLLAGLAAVAAASARAWLLVPVPAAYAVFSVLTYSRLRPRGGMRAPIDRARWREMKGFTLLAITGTVASAGFLNLSPVFAGRYDTPAALGRFSAALALVLPVYFFPRALSLALFPSIAFRYGREEGEHVRRQLDVSGRSLAVLLLAPIAVAAVGARLLLRWLFGGAYEEGADVLAVLLGATYLSVAQIPYVTALSGTERRWYKVPALASLGGFAVGLAAWVLLGPRYGAAGVAWGYLAGSVPQSAIPIAFAARAFGVPVASVAVRAAVVWGGVLAARLATGGAPSMPETFAAAAAVLAAFTALFARDLRAIGREVAARLRARRGAE